MKERVAYKMITEYIEAKYDFRAHAANIAEEKRDLGLPMDDVPNAVEELKQPRKYSAAKKSGNNKGGFGAFWNYSNNKLLCFVFFC